jgi:hypothetical protein
VDASPMSSSSRARCSSSKLLRRTLARDMRRAWREWGVMSVRRVGVEVSDSGLPAAEAGWKEREGVAKGVRIPLRGELAGVAVMATPATTPGHEATQCALAGRTKSLDRFKGRELISGDDAPCRPATAQYQAWRGSASHCRSAGDIFGRVYRARP